jgi:hypothetical protein
MTDVASIFKSRLPRRPYCTDTFMYGLKIRPVDDALLCRHIQPNAPHAVGWLVFDLDYRGAAFAWDKANLPPPTLTISNPENAHAHLFYGLVTPVCTSAAGRSAPIRYAAAIQAAYTARLCADPGYAHLVAKNPFHDDWRPLWVQHLYEFDELAEYVELPRRMPTSRERSGLGRNCALFDDLRAWAYAWVREYQRNGALLEQWLGAVLGQAERLNAFERPLSFNEVKGIAKSVARWTWREFSEAEFSAIQSARGKLGGRPRTTTREGAPWCDLGISRATYYRRVNSGLIVSSRIEW